MVPANYIERLKIPKDGNFIRLITFWYQRAHRETVGGGEIYCNHAANKAEHTQARPHADCADRTGGTGRLQARSAPEALAT